MIGEKKEKTIKILCKLAELAKELDCSQAQLALAWTCANKDTSVALMGFSRLSQVADNIGALTVLAKWSPEIEAKVEAILENMPTPEIDWKTFSPGVGRRSL